MDGSFSTFYEYFLYTKSWAYVLMIISIPAFITFWSVALFPNKKRYSLKNDDDNS